MMIIIPSHKLVNGLNREKKLQQSDRNKKKWAYKNPIITQQVKG